MAKVDRGFVTILIGVALVAVATFLAYVFEVVQNLDLKSVMVGPLWESRRTILAVAFYFPGTVLTGIGMSSWLPALQSLDHEIGRRRQTEDELRSLAGELERMAVKAEEANHAKSTFLASMSHELRTPLNAIIGFSEMIENEKLGPIENRSYVEYGGMINESGSLLLAIVSDVLDLSKVEAGKLVLEEEEVDVSRSLHDCIHLMSGQIEEAKIDFEMDLGDEAARILADPRILKQMVTNLLSNSLKFSDAGGSIHLSCSELKGAYCISVKDDGIGMTDEEIEQVVRPFAQVENVQTKSRGGTGLGLSIVKEMMRLHGGELVLTSEPDEGTTAMLVFPESRVI